VAALNGRGGNRHATLIMLNPIVFTERVVRDFLRYQITTYSFADPGLHAQLRALLNLDLSRPFRQGPAVAALTQAGLLHPHVANVAEHSNVYGHQEAAVRSIVAGRTTLISTGTGSGKTESFLYPIISRCLHLRDAAAPGGFLGPQLLVPMVHPPPSRADRLECPDSDGGGYPRSSG
jgi:ATP-dependent helicase YprA (DUF1998 family)